MQTPFGPDPISPKTCVLSGPLVALGPVVGVTEVAAYQPEKAGVAMTVSQVQERKVPEPPSCSGSSRFLRASSHAEAPDDPWVGTGWVQFQGRNRPADSERRRSVGTATHSELAPRPRRWSGGAQRLTQIRTTDTEGG